MPNCKIHASHNTCVCQTQKNPNHQIRTYMCSIVPLGRGKHVGHMCGRMRGSITWRRSFDVGAGMLAGFDNGSEQGGRGSCWLDLRWSHKWAKYWVGDVATCGELEHRWLACGDDCSAQLREDRTTMAEWHWWNDEWAWLGGVATMEKRKVEKERCTVPTVVAEDEDSVESQGCWLLRVGETFWAEGVEALQMS